MTQIGIPITSEQATRAVLRLIKSPIIGDINKDAGPGYTLSRIKAKKHGGYAIYDSLSGGEKHLVDIALSLWSPHSPDGAELSALGGLDKDNRRKVLMVLFYYHLGSDWPSSMTNEEFERTFADA
jgi:hypothetical protein